MSVVIGYVVETRPASTWTPIAAGLVLGVSGLAEISGDRANPLTPGDNATLTIDVELDASALASVPDRLPIRVTFTVGGVSAKSFVGAVRSATRSSKDMTWQLRCSGIADTLATVREASPVFFRLPIAAKTAVSSPISSTDATCTPLEWACLKAGGYPAARSFEAPNALFYYDFDQAMLAPDYVHFNGEDSWQELLKLARSSCGVLYQGQDGVLYYRQLLGFGDGSPLLTLTPSQYSAVSVSLSTDRMATRLKATYTTRRAYPLAEVLTDTTVRWIAAGATSETIPLEPDQPLDSLETSSGIVKIRANMPGVTLKPEALLVVDGVSSSVPQGASGYDQTLAVAAQHIDLTLTNHLSRPILVYKITLRGEPIAAGVTSSSTAGSGTTTRDLDDSFVYYIQRPSAADRLLKMALVYLQTARAVYEATGFIYNPSITLGSVVALTSTRLSLNAVRCLVVGIRHQDTGALADYTLVYVDDIPLATAFYTVGTTDYAGQTLNLAW